MKKVYSLILTLFLSASVFAVGHTVTGTTTNATCNGSCNGTASSSVSGGVGPFGYSWAGPSSFSSNAQNVVGLCAGTYTITVIDSADMSTANYIQTVLQPAALTMSVGSPTVCSGSCTTLTPTVTGGTLPYTFIWSGGLFGVSPSACPSSTISYTVTVSDANGCTTSAVSTVATTSAPTVTVPASATYCPGAIVPSGVFSSTPAGATFVWTNSNVAIGLAVSGISSIPSFTAINAGPSSITSTITVTPTYAGCVGTPNTYTITVNPIPTVTVSPSSTICSGACVTLSATTTPGPSTYSWIGPAAFVATIASPIICPAIAGTYTVTASYAGCTATAITTVNIDGPITPNLSSTNTTGCVTCDGTATATPTGGTAPYAYVWSNGTTTIPVPSMCAGTYSVTITDIAGCTATDSTTIFANNSAITNFTMVPDSTDPYNFFAFNTSTGIGNSYSWDWGDGTAFSTTANPAHTWGSTGVMTVCLTVSNFLCGADTLCQTVNVTGVPVSCLALFNIADDTINPDPNAHYVYNLSYGATLSYFWDFGDGTTSSSMTPSHVYSGTGPYLLCLSVDNGAGCTDMFCDSLISADSLNRSSGTMQIIVHNGPSFQGLTTGIVDQESITTVSVSPNPFSENTTFIIQSDKINEKYSFELLDVLGKKVKTLNGISEKQFEISRNGLQNGVYFYKIYSAESIVGIGKLVIE